MDHNNNQQQKGISIELPIHVIEELNNKEQLRKSSSNNKNRLVPKGLEALGVVTDQDDWNCLLVQPKTDDNDDDNVNNEEEEEESNSKNESSTTKGENDNNDDESSILSYTPPDTLPIVWVDVERLTGYRPPSIEDTMGLQETVKQALWGSEVVKATNNDNDEKKSTSNSENELVDDDQIVLARDFEERVTELFNTGLARHADTSMEINNNNNNNSESCYFLPVEYPEYLCRVNKLEVLSTERIWKKLLQSHEINVVDRLFMYLRTCSRSLLWKYDMKQEIMHLIENELNVYNKRMQQEEIWYWKTTRRKEQLEKLYTVRETIQEQYNISKTKLQIHEDELNYKVRNEFQKRRLLNQGYGGLQGFDFDSTVFAFPENNTQEIFTNFFGLKNDDDDYYNDNYYPYNDNDENDYYNNRNDNDDDSYNNDEYDNNGDDDELSTSNIDDDDNNSINAETNLYGENEESPIHHDITNSGKDSHLESNNDMNENHGPIETAKEKQQQQKELQEEDEATKKKEEEHMARLEAAKEEEKKVRELCTTQEYRIAVAVKNALEKKLQQVDDLLETLQEEEWADEEEEGNGIVVNEPSLPIEDDDDDNIDDGASLLDQILAMILGAYPPPVGTTSIETHIQFLEQEHKSILNDWKDYFGRLPPPITSSLSNTTTTESTTTNNNTTTTTTTNPWDDDRKRGMNNNKNSTSQQQQQQQQSDGRVESLRTSLGIVDNDDENWDDDDDNEAVDNDNNVGQSKSVTTETNKKEPVYGFRPGGRLPF